MSINFYVYINEPNDKAFIHHAECSFCNFGKGLVAEGHSNNGKWDCQCRMNNTHLCRSKSYQFEV